MAKRSAGSRISGILSSVVSYSFTTAMIVVTFRSNVRFGSSVAVGIKPSVSQLRAFRCRPQPCIGTTDGRCLTAECVRRNDHGVVMVLSPGNTPIPIANPRGGTQPQSAEAHPTDVSSPRQRRR
jgi:hypothetical protein